MFEYSVLFQLHKLHFTKYETQKDFETKGLSKKRKYPKRCNYMLVFSGWCIQGQKVLHLECLACVWWWLKAIEINWRLFNNLQYQRTKLYPKCISRYIQNKGCLEYFKMVKNDLTKVWMRSKNVPKMVLKRSKSCPKLVGSPNFFHFIKWHF